jgi:hypothetical protein
MFINDIYILKDSDPFEIKAQEEATINLELVKSPPCYQTLLVGKVLYQCSPIKNATVIALANKGSLRYSTETDENGTYRLRNILEPGKYNVTVSVIGYKTSLTKTILVSENQVASLSFEMKKSSIAKNGIIYGKILESGSRRPIEDACIYLKSVENCKEVLYKTKSNQSGQYLIYNILPNVYQIEIEKQGYMVTDSMELKVDKFDRLQLYFDLIRATKCNNTISGTITHKEQIIHRAAVFLYRFDKEGIEILVQTQETNELGVFLFTNVEPGSYLLKAKSQNREVFEEHYQID